MLWDYFSRALVAFVIALYLYYIAIAADCIYLYIFRLPRSQDNVMIYVSLPPGGDILDLIKKKTKNKNTGR